MPFEKGHKINVGNRSAVKHGRRNSPEYTAWCNMKARCYDKHNHKYPTYGGVGIMVCDRWRNSFENFFADMGLRPTPDHSIDRFPDNDGNYEPTNCRWATKQQQAENRPLFNRRIEYDGRIQSLAAWAREFGINRDTLKWRLDNGWTFAKATQENNS